MAETLSKELDVSIVVASRNRASALDATLKSLAKVEMPEGLRVEVVLIDNGSTDSTFELMSGFRPGHMEVVVLKQPAPGKSRALNLGVSKARGKVLLYTDDDVRFPKHWIQGVCAPIIAGEADAVAGGVVIADYLLRDWMRPLHRSWLASTEEVRAPEPDRLVGANMAISREAVNSLGGVDENLGPGALGFGEETLLTFQLKEAGYRVVSALDVKVVHCFDESRLEREGQLDIAKKMGQTDAYLDVHWRRRRYSYFKLWGALSYYRMMLCKLRVFEPKSRNLPPSELEMRLVRKVARFRQQITEQQRDRKCRPNP